MRDALLRLPSTLIGGLSPASVPRMSRPSYRWEALTALLFPLALGCVEAGVIGVIAKKSFAAPPIVIATLAAAPPLANITSVWWTRWLRGRDRIAATNALQIAVILCVLGVAAAPRNTFGTAALVLLMLLARSFMTGIIGARTDIWRSNYPRSDRARITGKLWILVSLTVGVSAMATAMVMDRASDAAPWAFRAVYVAAALLALGGVWAFSHVRWRGAVATIAQERTAPPPGDHDPATPRGMLRVLRNDRAYRSFMAAQFVLGIANIAALAPFIIAIDEEFSLGYTQSIALTQALPFLVPIIVIPIWARLLDRVHIVRFRVYHSWFFVAANALIGLGVILHNVPLLYVARIVLGVAYGGGMLAWNLGHHDFAPRHMASVYMGIHVALTGVRGAIAPFIGAMLYDGWSLRLAGAHFAWAGLRGWSFFVFAAGAAVGAIMFLQLQRDIGRAGRLEPAQD